MNFKYIITANLFIGNTYIWSTSVYWLVVENYHEQSENTLAYLFIQSFINLFTPYISSTFN